SRRRSRTSRQSPATAAAVSSARRAASRSRRSALAKEALQADVRRQDHAGRQQDQGAWDQDQGDHQADLRGGAGGAAPRLLRPGPAHVRGQLDQGAGEGGAELFGLEQRADELRQAGGGGGGAGGRGGS